MKSGFIRLILCGVLGVSLTAIVHAAGPSTVAKSNTTLWPDPITSKQAFDKASRAEILIFLSVYKENFNAEMKAADLNIKSFNAVSFERWKNRFKTYWLNTFIDATKSCKNDKEMGCSFKETDFAKLLNYAENFSTTLPEKYTAWKNMSRDFYQTYLKEQARLAALFPHPTSEILPLTDTEILGDRFKDGEFLLTLDDGPTQTDDTKKYAQLLRTHGISAFFFALGDALETKLKKNSPQSLKDIYQGHCLASHGYHHNSHQKWVDWKDSLNKTEDLIQKITENNSPVQFRPPYGQRQKNLTDYLATKHASVILWNIDSQDWQRKLSPPEVSVRIQKLMLLWRKGIILFHDVHKKGFVAIPDAIQLGKTAQLQWMDCSKI